MFPLPSSHSSLLQFFPALTLCHGNRPKSKTPPAAALFTLHTQSHRTPDSTSLISSSKESLALLLPKTATPPLICICSLNFHRSENPVSLNGCLGHSSTHVLSAVTPPLPNQKAARLSALNNRVGGGGKQEVWEAGKSRRE